MIKLVSISLLFLLCVAGRAGSLITATITVTNSPADGDTLTINGSARTWKSAVATPATQIAIGANAGASATNLFNHAAAYRFTTTALGFSSSNVVTIRGIVDQTMTVSISGTWGYYTLSTNTTTSANAVIVPISSYATLSTGTNVISQLASDLGKSSNALANGTTLLQGVVQTNQTQTINGTKTFTGANVYSNTTQQFVGGSVSGASLEAITNAYITNLYIAGSAYLSNATPRLRFSDTDASSDNKNIDITMSSGDLYFIAWDDALGSYSYFAQFDRTGSTVDSVKFPNGEVQVGGGGAGTEALRVTGSTRFDRIDVTSLANGNNAAVDRENRTFVKFSSGPTAAFAICGIAAGSNGDMVILYNPSAYNMTIANDSGVDPTAANRIYTNTGADVSTTGAGVATLIYDSGVSRWILVSIQQ